MTEKDDPRIVIARNILNVWKFTLVVHVLIVVLILVRGYNRKPAEAPDPKAETPITKTPN